MDVVLEILKFIGVFPTFILLGGIICISFFFWYRNGLKIGSITIFERSIKVYPKVVHDYIENCEYDELNEGSFYISYFIPPKNSAIKIVGKWDSALEEHKKMIEKIERDWNGSTAVDIKDCNLSSAILSLIEDKYAKEGEMLIVHSADQENMIKRYFSQFEGIKFQKK